MLSVKIRKEILYGHLNELFKPNGYNLINTGEDPRYLQKNPNEVRWVGFHFLKGGSITTGLHSSINEVEKIILEIGKPGFRKNIYLERKKYFLPTIRDVQLENIMKEKYHLYTFKTEEEFTQFAQWLYHYIENQGLPYLEHYSFLPNILTKMDGLMANEGYWNGILSGLADYLFRGLIISKLCGDRNLKNKIQYCNEKLNSRESLANWLPYYEKLKEKLKVIEPKYNASLGRVFDNNEII